MGSGTLIIDADDTLWENNIYFEQAADHFLELVAARGLPKKQARQRLIEVERKNVPLHGYGSRCFARSLQETLEEMAGTPATAPEMEVIESLADRVANIPIQFLPGVKETLVQLRERFRLIMFTKGDPPEQWGKVNRSGVAPLFHHVEVTTEKSPQAYRRLIDRYGLEPPRTWMIGNSPNSDVNPAVEAGLNAILIPHPRTWELEHGEVEEDGVRVRVVERFEDLLGIL